MDTRATKDIGLGVEYVALAASDDLTGHDNGTHDPLAKPNDSLRNFTRSALETFNDNTGLLLIALSQGFASLMGVFVKKLHEVDPPVPPLELIWVRMIMTWIVCVVYMSINKIPDSVLGPKEVRFLLAFRGLAGFFGLFGTYYALQYLSLSDTTVLSFLTPMCTAITGALLLKEDLTVKQVLASLLSFVGVVLIARPEFIFGRQQGTEDGIERVITPAQRLGAVGVALLGVVGLTSAYTTIRAIGKRAHAMHNLGAFSLLCIITAPIGMALTGTPVMIPDDMPCLLMILAVSACGFGAQMTMTTGLQRETAGRGTMAIYVQVIFALIFERVFFHTTPTPLSIVGTVIILSSAMYIALSKRSASQTPVKSKPSSEEAALEAGLLEDDQNSEEEHELQMFDSVQQPREKFSIGSSDSFDPQPGSSKSISSIEGI